MKSLRLHPFLAISIEIILIVMNWFIKTRHRGNNEIRQIFEGIASDKEAYRGK